MKKNQKKIILTLLFLILSSCSSLKNAGKPAMANTEQSSHPSLISAIKKEELDPGPAVDMKKCVCVQLWMPVCGENGKTYSNACFAKCANVPFKPGSCTKLLTD